MSKITKFTPGPWRATFTPIGFSIWSEDKKVATVESSDDIPVIAAAPAMYDILTEVLEWMESMGFQHESATAIGDKIINAQALARGETTDQ